MKRSSVVVVALAVANFLAACGGGGSDASSRVNVVKVVGASLADSGTYDGMKFTVQSGGSEPYLVYTEHVTQAYGLPSLCPAYRATTEQTFLTQPACTNHAVAGAAIHFGVFSDTNQDGVSDTFTTAPNVPLSQLFQLAALGQQGFDARDLLIVGEGSANDVAMLITAYLTDVRTQGGTSLFKQMVDSLMKDGGVTSGAGVGAADHGAGAGAAYMRALAQTLTQAVRTQALARGAKKVVVLNTLDVTQTPRMKAALAPLGEADRLALVALFQGWINVYNQALNEAVKAWPNRVVVVDIHEAFVAQLAHPQDYGISEITHTVCDQTYHQQAQLPEAPNQASAGTTSLSTPAVRVSCTDTYASTITPTVGSGADWWRSYLYADNFHPTPLGHELLGEVVARRLREAGWL